MMDSKQMFANVWGDMTLLLRRVIALEGKLTIGEARPLATKEKATTWREITVGDQKFRVLTMEDK